jgi:anti-sigma regulatory factor (Ser/Thr protein kinase)
MPRCLNGYAWCQGATVTQTRSGATPSTPKVTARLSTVHDLAKLRDLVAATATSAGLAPDPIWQLSLAVHEIAANALIHGTPPVSVTMTVTDTAITVAVHDRGNGFGHHLLATPHPQTDRIVAATPPSTEALQGRGLWLAIQMADRVSLTTDSTGTTVVVTIAMGTP